MKSFITLCAICSLVAVQTVAQKIAVTTSIENVGGGNNPVIEVFIPHTNAKTAEKKWNSFLKDYRAKVKSSKGEITGKNFVLREADTMQVYSRITESDQGAKISAAFDSKGTFVAPGVLQSSYDLLATMLRSFALPLAKEGLDKKVEVATEALQEKTKAQQTLVKRNKHLGDANEKMKREISDNEREASDNEGKIANLKSDVDKHQETVNTIKAKEKELE